MYRTKTRRNKDIPTKKNIRHVIIIIILWIYRDALFNILLISRDYRRCCYVVRGTPCPEIRSIQCDQSRRCSRLRETYKCDDIHTRTCRGETSVKRDEEEKKTGIAIRSIELGGEKITGGKI